MRASMWKEIVDHPRFLGYSLLLHVILSTLLVVSFDWRMTKKEPEVNIIEATAVDEQLVQAELDRIKAIEIRKVREDKARERKIAKEEKTLKNLAEEKGKAQTELAAELEKKRQEQERIAKLQKEKEQLTAKQEAEKKRLEKLQKEKEELEEKKRKELEHLADLELEAIAKAEEAERKKKELEKLEQERLKKLREQEEDRKASQKKAELDKARAQYRAMIEHQVRINWTKTAGNACTLKVHQNRLGEVDKILPVGCRGQAYIDSLRRAVLKASPLPAPPVPEVFEADLDIIFDPNKK